MMAKCDENFLFGFSALEKYFLRRERERERERERHPPLAAVLGVHTHVSCMLTDTWQVSMEIYTSRHGSRGAWKGFRHTNRTTEPALPPPPGLQAGGVQTEEVGMS